jgi:hypothetical protein
MSAAERAIVEHISKEDLAALITRQMSLAADRGLSHVREPEAFRAHLVDVAFRAEHTAMQLVDTLPGTAAPDPCALFIAGAWHDGGKIWSGDDFHEIASALDLLEHGRTWGLVRGPRDAAEALLRRAARAILAGFAVYEQWQPTYRPTYRPRTVVMGTYQRLGAALYPGRRGQELERLLLLPQSIDPMILMHSDFEGDFERRWQDIERRSRTDDPALAIILPAVKPRIRGGCAVVDTLLGGGDGKTLARFVRDFGGSGGSFKGEPGTLQTP